MKNIKILIGITGILIIGLIISILLINSNNKENDENGIQTSDNINNANIILSEDEGATGATTEQNMILLNDRNEFFAIEKMINNYCLYLKVGNIEAVYCILDNIYKNTEGINNQNVLQIARQNMPYEGEYKIQEIYVTNYQNINIYYIKGIMEKDYTKISSCFTMYKDLANGSYSLKPISYNEYLTYTSNGQKEEYNNIELTKYNAIVNIVISDEEMAKKYFNSYIHNARYFPDEAYQSLDEEYRDAKFGSFENYKEYLASRATELENLDYTYIRDISEFSSEEEYKKYIYNLEKKSIDKFYINNEENYCVCVDGYNNYYIFEILDIMNYKLILDTYTLDLPEFIEQYEEADEQEKVELNINKIFKALNDQDYNYVYSKLDETYKNSYFSDIETFKSQLSNALFTKNNVELLEYTVEENEHKYSLGITDAEGSDENGVKLTIIVILGENTDFTIKFE